MPCTHLDSREALQIPYKDGNRCGKHHWHSSWDQGKDISTERQEAIIANIFRSCGAHKDYFDPQ